MNRYTFAVDPTTASLMARQIRWRAPWISRSSSRAWATSILRLCARNGTSPDFYLRIHERFHRRTRRHGFTGWSRIR